MRLGEATGFQQRDEQSDHGNRKRQRDRDTDRHMWGCEGADAPCGLFLGVGDTGREPPAKSGPGRGDGGPKRGGRRAKAWGQGFLAGAQRVCVCSEGEELG